MNDKARYMGYVKKPLLNSLIVQVSVEKKPEIVRRDEIITIKDKDTEKLFFARRVGNYIEKGKIGTVASHQANFKIINADSIPTTGSKCFISTDEEFRSLVKKIQNMGDRDKTTNEYKFGVYDSNPSVDMTLNAGIVKSRNIGIFGARDSNKKGVVIKLIKEMCMADFNKSMMAIHFDILGEWTGKKTFNAYNVDVFSFSRMNNGGVDTCVPFWLLTGEEIIKLIEPESYNRDLARAYERCITDLISKKSLPTDIKGLQNYEPCEDLVEALLCAVSSNSDGYSIQLHDIIKNAIKIGGCNFIFSIDKDSLSNLVNIIDPVVDNGVRIKMLNMNSIGREYATIMVPALARLITTMRNSKETAFYLDVVENYFQGQNGVRKEFIEKYLVRELMRLGTDKSHSVVVISTSPASLPAKILELCETRIITRLEGLEAKCVAESCDVIALNADSDFVVVNEGKGVPFGVVLSAKEYMPYEDLLPDRHFPENG